MEHEKLFNTFDGINRRDNPRFPGYIYDVLGRVIGIILIMFVILLILSFLAFATKPFNMTITRVIELFWRDYTYLFVIPLSLPSLIKSIKNCFKHQDKSLWIVTIVYLMIILSINVMIAVFGTIPILKFLGA